MAKNIKNHKVLGYDKKLIPLAKALRNNMTLSEVILWNHLKNRNVLNIKFSRQVPISNYIVDFFSAEIMLAIEIDGNSHDEKIEYDKKRQEELEKLGIKFFRIYDVDIKQNLNSVLGGLRNKIKEMTEE